MIRLSPNVPICLVWAAGAVDAVASVAAVATAAGSLLVEAIVAVVAVAVEAMRLIKCEQTAPLPYKVQRYLLGRGPRCSRLLNC
jgi:hypothetical protein